MSALQTLFLFWAHQGGAAQRRGGAVDGRKFYGAYPDLTVGGGGTQDTPNNNRGRWIPTTSVDQYASTLASWFGLDANAMSAVFPNLSKFSTADLGFLS